MHLSMSYQYCLPINLHGIELLLHCGSNLYTSWGLGTITASDKFAILEFLSILIVLPTSSVLGDTPQTHAPSSFSINLKMNSSSIIDNAWYSSQTHRSGFLLLFGTSPAWKYQVKQELCNFYKDGLTHAGCMGWFPLFLTTWLYHSNISTDDTKVSRNLHNASKSMMPFACPWIWIEF